MSRVSEGRSLRVREKFQWSVRMLRVLFQSSAWLSKTSRLCHKERNVPNVKALEETETSQLQTLFVPVQYKYNAKIGHYFYLSSPSKFLFSKFVSRSIY